MIRGPLGSSIGAWRNPYETNFQISQGRVKTSTGSESQSCKAITLLRERAPDLLLLDLKMPRMSGHDALEQIRGDSRLCTIPVAVLTSSERDEDIAKSYGLGGNHFIVKPKDIQELQRKLHSLLKNLPELGGIRRGSMGTSATAVSGVDPDTILMSKVLRLALVLGVLVALYFFGRILGAF